MNARSIIARFSAYFSAYFSPRRFACALASLSLFSLAPAWAAPRCEDPVGAWVNEFGSGLEITQVDPNTGQLDGHYVSSTGTSGKQFKLIGWVNRAPEKPEKSHATVISFSVRWAPHGSVTSWSGYCLTVNGVPTLRTVWNLVRPNADFHWEHVITNSTTFTPRR